MVMLKGLMMPPHPSLDHFGVLSMRISMKAFWFLGVGVKVSTASVTGIAGSAFMVALSTTPNEPPPAPRSAQNSSLFWTELHVRISPSGVTILISSTRSTPMPY
ncbi:hypothetical protein RRF57_009465 [Xylaria bambusicola]|uniref:Uncharacterized protein n=1 Tax=Xylaria bambusicola TaxID=326684 RepID=A0AAN7UVL4_9PEZI